MSLRKEVGGFWGKSLKKTQQFSFSPPNKNMTFTDIYFWVVVLEIKRPIIKHSPERVVLKGLDERRSDSSVSPAPVWWFNLRRSDNVSARSGLCSQCRPLICRLSPSQSGWATFVLLSGPRPVRLPSSSVNPDEASGGARPNAPASDWSEINQPFNPSLKDHYPAPPGLSACLLQDLWPDPPRSFTRQETEQREAEEGRDLRFGLELFKSQQIDCRMFESDAEQPNWKRFNKQLLAMLSTSLPPLSGRV